MNDDDLVITLKMALEADLRLKFYEPSTFGVWRRGLEKVMSLIFAPGWVPEPCPGLHNSAGRVEGQPVCLPVSSLCTSALVREQLLGATQRCMALSVLHLHGPACGDAAPDSMSRCQAGALASAGTQHY